MPEGGPAAPLPAAPLTDRFEAVRARTVALVDGLTPEDCQVQSMPDASPAKWHLAHSTWFFETFVLAASPAYRPYDERFAFLFNSYYERVGDRPPRPERGLVTRPSLDEVLAYRRHVDDAVVALVDTGSADAELVELGLAHEEQHQELIQTDLLHAFSLNPLRPTMRQGAEPTCFAGPLRFIDFPAGFAEIGAPDSGFAYDNERPRHRVWLQPYAIASRPVTNAEYRAFIADRGYTRGDLWLSDGWAAVQRDGWTRPLYWSNDLDHEFTVYGTRRLDPDAPVRHLSHYEADAYARWAGARLPTELEWERAYPDLGSLGAVWEWTGSAYLGYPGFRPSAGAVGEYNGKFMSGQMVLRGSSRFTAPGHTRPSYRNFFPPAARWQCAGLRLARDA